MVAVEADAAAAVRQIDHPDDDEVRRRQLADPDPPFGLLLEHGVAERGLTAGAQRFEEPDDLVVGGGAEDLQLEEVAGQAGLDPGRCDQAAGPDLRERHRRLRCDAPPGRGRKGTRAPGPPGAGAHGGGRGNGRRGAIRSASTTSLAVRRE